MAIYWVNESLVVGDRLHKFHQVRHLWSYWEPFNDKWPIEWGRGCLYGLLDKDLWSIYWQISGVKIFLFERKYYYSRRNKLYEQSWQMAEFLFVAEFENLQVLKWPTLVDIPEEGQLVSRGLGGKLWLQLRTGAKSRTHVSLNFLPCLSFKHFPKF